MNVAMASELNGTNSMQRQNTSSNGVEEWWTSLLLKQSLEENVPFPCDETILLHRSLVTGKHKIICNKILHPASAAS
jgi:hypothetical protein